MGSTKNKPTGDNSNKRNVRVTVKAFAYWELLLATFALILLAYALWQQACIDTTKPCERDFIGMVTGMGFKIIFPFLRLGLAILLKYSTDHGRDAKQAFAFACVWLVVSPPLDIFASVVLFSGNVFMAMFGTFLSFYFVASHVLVPIHLWNLKSSSSV